MENEYNLPRDWKDPDWHIYDRIHCWRNYASKDIKKEWTNFTGHQKKILSIAFNERANAERWD